MNRDEILKAAQTEENETGEYEKTISRKAVAYGAALGVMLCVVMILIELLVFKRMDYGKPTIIFCISAYANIYEGKKNNNKHMKMRGVIDLILTLCGLLLYVGELMA